MINLDGLTKGIINQLKSYTGANEVIFADQDAKKPKLPYLTLKVTTPYGEPEGLPIDEMNIVESSNSEFEFDIEYNVVSFPSVALSINAYGDDSFVFIQKAREWFNNKQLNQEVFDSYEAVVREITAIQNRDAILGDITFERKQGFDVILEIKDITKIREDTIEIVEIKEGI